MVVSAGAVWRPILAGSLAERARETVGQFAESLGQFVDEPLGNFSLGEGDAGMALFYAYLARTTGEDAHDAPARRYLERAVAALSETRVAPDLYAGFCGVAWAVEHLATAGTDADEDVNQTIDEVLEAGLREARPEAAWWQRYDLITGLVGLGVYALERMPRPSAVRILELVVRHLAAVSETAADGITWRTEPEQLPLRSRQLTPEGNFNLGVAHGVPGVIGLLGLVSAAGISLPRTRELLDGAMSWFLARRLPRGGKAEFNGWLSPNGNPLADRVSWCYGNPGIAVTLLVAARAVGNEDWEREAVDLALASAARDPRDSKVVDASFCHGAAGNGHLFNRLFQATGDTRFRDASVAWFERTFELRRPGRGLAGFEFLVLDSNQENAWVGTRGILIGISGVGLALLAAMSGVDPAWDRMMLASPLAQG